MEHPISPSTDRVMFPQLCIGWTIRKENYYNLRTKNVNKRVYAWLHPKAFSSPEKLLPENHIYHSPPF